MVAIAIDMHMSCLRCGRQRTEEFGARSFGVGIRQRLNLHIQFLLVKLLGQILESKMHI